MGVQAFPGRGVLMIITMETYSTCYFSGGGGVRIPFPSSGSAHTECFVSMFLSVSMNIGKCVQLHVVNIQSNQTSIGNKSF